MLANVSSQNVANKQNPKPALSTVSGILAWLINQMRPLANQTSVPWIVKAELRSLANEYREYRYGSIQDPDTKEFVDIRVSSFLARKLQECNRYAFSGTLTINHYHGKMRPLFLVQRVFRIDNKQSQFENLRQTFQEEMRRPKRNVEEILLAAESPHILLLAGRTSKVTEDIKSCVWGFEGIIQLEERLVNIENPASIVSGFRDLNDPVDLIAITRGGGDTIKNLDDRELISVVSSCPIPTAVAAGHQTDTLLLEEVADIAFGTPSKFGEFLRRVAERKIFQNERKLNHDLEPIDREVEILGRFAEVRREPNERIRGEVKW